MAFPQVMVGLKPFAERLSLYLTGMGWEVVVYCQTLSAPEQDKRNEPLRRRWNGIELVEIPVSKDNALSTILFDFKATLHSLKEESLVLVLGYNTAIFFFSTYLGREDSVNKYGWIRVAS